jgi:hypothetical protein
VIVAKLFLWPLLLWLVATRRYAHAAAAVVGGALATLAAWAVLGFAGMRDYLHVLRVLSDVEQSRGYSPIALGLSLGLSSGAARALALVVGAVAVLGIFVLARRPDGERLSLTATIAAALLLSPIVWLHYMVLLLVPLALSRPRLSAAWLVLPIPFWFATTNGQSHGHVALIVVTMVTAAAVLLVGARETWAIPRPALRRARAAASAAR